MKQGVQESNIKRSSSGERGSGRSGLLVLEERRDQLTRPQSRVGLLCTLHFFLAYNFQILVVLHAACCRLHAWPGAEPPNTAIANHSHPQLNQQGLNGDKAIPSWVIDRTIVPLGLPRTLLHITLTL